MDKYYVNAAGVSLPLNNLISTCLLHSHNPVLNAIYLLQGVYQLANDAIQTEVDVDIVASTLINSAKHIQEAEAQLGMSPVAEQRRNWQQRVKIRRRHRKQQNKRARLI